MNLRYLLVPVLLLFGFALTASADTIVTVTADVGFINYGTFVASYDFDTTTNTLMPDTLNYNFTGAFAPYTFNGQVGGFGINFTSTAFPGVFLQLFFKDHGELFPNLGNYCTCDVELNNTDDFAFALVLPGSFVTVKPTPPSVPEPTTLSLLLIGYLAATGFSTFRKRSSGSALTCSAP